MTMENFSSNFPAPIEGMLTDVSQAQKIQEEKLPEDFEDLISFVGSNQEKKSSITPDVLEIWNRYRDKEDKDWTPEFSALSKPLQIIVATAIPLFGNRSETAKILGQSLEFVNAVLDNPNAMLALSAEIRRYVLSKSDNAVDQKKFLLVEYLSTYATSIKPSDKKNILDSLGKLWGLFSDQDNTNNKFNIVLLTDEDKIKAMKELKERYGNPSEKGRGLHSDISA